jgi:hypothetical protein
MSNLQKFRSIPLAAITAVSLSITAFSLTAYLKSYSVLHDFNVYVGTVSVSANEKVELNVTFILYNPSEYELKLIYIKEDVFLNGNRILINDPFVSKYQLGREYISLLSTGNSTVNVVVLIERKNFPDYNPSANNHWSFRVVVSLENVPLIGFATLTRFAVFQNASYAVG